MPGAAKFGWTQYFDALKVNAPAAAQAKIGGTNQVAVSHPKLEAMINAITKDNNKQVSAQMIANYLNFRVLWSLR